MGGGHLSRPDFGMPQPDPAHPLTEFYLLLQHGLDKAGVFHLPALYASFRAPARRIYTDEAAGYLTLSETADEGAVLLSAPRNLQLLYSSLHVMPDGAPVALLLTEECTRTVVAVQLLPPFVWEDPLPPLPDVPAALTLQLTVQDVEAIDADPAALGRRLVGSPAGKCWLTHPKAETFLAERVALLQECCKGISNVSVESFDGLTVEFAKKRHASVMVRGLRAVTDFENEIQLAQTNHALMPGIETMFLATSIKWSYLSSTIVKEAARYGSDIGKFVTPNVEKAVNEKYALIRQGKDPEI